MVVSGSRRILSGDGSRRPPSGCPGSVASRSRVSLTSVPPACSADDEIDLAGPGQLYRKAYRPRPWHSRWPITTYLEVVAATLSNWLGCWASAMVPTAAGVFGFWWVILDHVQQDQDLAFQSPRRFADIRYLAELGSLGMIFLRHLPQLLRHSSISGDVCVAGAHDGEFERFTVGMHRGYPGFAQPASM